MSDQSSVSEFRRWIVGISDTVLMLAVLLSTVGGGLAGYSWARLVTSISGISEGGAFRGTSAHPVLLFGALCGAALGFIGSAAASGAAFALSEIAYHSRRMAEIFEKAREDSAGPLVMPGHVLEARSSQASIRPTNRVHDSHPRATNSDRHSHCGEVDNRRWRTLVSGSNRSHQWGPRGWIPSVPRAQQCDCVPVGFGKQDVLPL